MKLLLLLLLGVVFVAAVPISGDFDALNEDLDSDWADWKTQHGMLNNSLRTAGLNLAVFNGPKGTEADAYAGFM